MTIVCGNMERMVGRTESGDGPEREAEREAEMDQVDIQVHGIIAG